MTILQRQQQQPQEPSNELFPKHPKHPHPSKHNHKPTITRNNVKANVNTNSNPRVVFLSDDNKYKYVSSRISKLSIQHNNNNNNNNNNTQLLLEPPPPSHLEATTMKTTNTTNSNATTTSNKDNNHTTTTTTTATDQHCLPLADWQTQSFVNCNTVHELDMKSQMTTMTMTTAFLGQGWFRSAWNVHHHNHHMVLKTLRLDREFLPEYYELHRRDAVAMERLTFSPFVMDVYAYCGQSALNEIAGMEVANGRESIYSLEQLDRRMRGKQGLQVERLKLQLAVSVAMGLSHVHNVNNPGIRNHHHNNNTTNSTTTATTLLQRLPAMAHYDINPRNIAIVKGGRPKLNDFNICEFLTYNTTTNQTCGFPSRLHEPWWRAPEEMNTNTTHHPLITEKVDVYALGNVLYHIWTTHSPRGKMKKERMDAVREMVRQGISPNIKDPDYFPSSSNHSHGHDHGHDHHPIAHAFVQAMELCFHPDPQQRGTVLQVATVLYDALDKEKEKQEEER